MRMFGLPSHASSDLQTVPNMEEAESVAPYNTTVTREVSTELSLHREGTLLATRGSSMEVSTTHSCLTLSDQPSGRRDLAPTSSQRILKEHTYANLCGKQPERREAVHPHYTGDYERAPDYAPPSIPITGGSQAVEHFSDYERDPNYHHSEGLGSTRHVGDYERDPFYQPLQPHKSKQPVVSHEYSALKDSTLDSPQEYTIPQPRIHQ